ncbi:MAG: outer membrane beta-barrel protein [Flammeovirgaceae bacterium]|nr:outer membrane beta-barrel protein [Flammeovirgaceae bacterium]
MFLFGIVISCLAQPDSVQTNYSLSVFVDVFYAQNFEGSAKGNLYPFLYNYNRNESISLNHGWIGFNAFSQKFRTNVALQAGTYVQDNYASEPEWAKVIREANLGIALNRQNTIWLDVGVFSSHIGFESAGSLENWTLTRSIIAENSPYYLNGVKLAWPLNQSWEFSLLGFNGWQRIYASGKFYRLWVGKSNINQTKQCLTGVLLLEMLKSNGINRMRFFNNLYMQTNFTKNISLIADLDWGMQESIKTMGLVGCRSDRSLSIQQFVFNRTRAEYYYDKQGFVTSPVNLNAGSFSLNFDYTPIPIVMLRSELRTFVSNKSP